MSWHKIVIPDEEIGEKLAAEIVAAFERVFDMAGAPHNAALFETKVLRHPRVFYFTPGVTPFFGELLKGFAAVDCEAPPAASVVPLCANGDTNRFFQKHFTSK